MRKTLAVFCFFVSLAATASAAPYENIRVAIMNGDYKTAISAGEKMLDAKTHSDELYYLLGIAYLKDGNFLRASDIFEIVATEFPNSRLREEAALGAQDAYFLRGDFTRAQGGYESFLSKYPNSKYKASVYYRLSQIFFKNGDADQGKSYLDKIKLEFPMNPEALFNQNICPVMPEVTPVTPLSPQEAIIYSVQVGSFSSTENAKNLVDKLTAQGYPAFMEEFKAEETASYRVRVGKMYSRTEAEDLATKLAQEGYPIKICP